MRITVNGESRQVADGATVATLLPADAAGVAVAVNGAVVPRSRHQQELREGDDVEVVTAVQGG
ncbi:sulfur carrier protein ThiS [Nocardioides limicola]|uniref:sulfur carrier protein ThiS n=1 Tax=Nocardioides limicola TaxID=2803368 RepID=UPI00193C321D|nr:sulfur carrier protein ThiS [Nocardioides sp. DJM-14]